MTPYSRISSWSKTISFTFLVIGISCLVNIILGSNDSCYATTSATLKLGTSSLNTTTTQGETAYLSSTISATTTDTESYTLTITGPTSLTGATNITGAGGKTGSTMSNNTWGYSYNQAGNNSNKTYTSFTGTAQTLESGTIANGSTKNITFAAKFSNDAIAGHYTAKVVVGLVAEPKVTAGWNDLVYMQDMTPEACAEAPLHESKTLTDKRDDSSYTIMKWADDRCWMTTQLKLFDKVITPEDSNVTSNFTVPASVSGGFSAMSSTDGYAPMAKTSQYYNWYTATAGAGDATMNSGVATTSICPKGWRLPTAGEGSEYDVLLKAVNPSDSTTFSKAPYNFSNIRVVIDGSTMNSGVLTGYWWSSVAYDGAKAYGLSYTASKPGVAANSQIERYYGAAIRCIADDGKPVKLPTVYTLQYDVNGGSGSVPAAQTATSFAQEYVFTIPTSPVPTKTWQEFKCWSKKKQLDAFHSFEACRQEGGFQPGDQITLQEAEPSVVLYAIYGDED